MPKRLAVVIPSFRHWDYTEAALDSLARTTPDSVAVVIDDASPDYAKWKRRADEYMADRLRFRFIRCDTHAGLTRSWNAGLVMARDLGYDYAAVTNNDVLFTKGWHEPLIAACEAGWALVGPVSNAAGSTNPHQFVGDYIKDYKLSDDAQKLDDTARTLAAEQAGVVKGGRPNGFCMLAAVATWWAGAFDPKHVFNPAKPMVGNEDELEGRWLKAKRKMGVIPASFVFHYRSVARGDRYRKGRWMRRKASS